MGGGRRHELKLMKQRSMSRSGSVLMGVEKARCERGFKCVEDIPRAQFWPIRLYVLCLYADIDLEILSSIYAHT
jgi:hypothetical protein